MVSFLSLIQTTLTYFGLLSPIIFPPENSTKQIVATTNVPRQQTTISVDTADGVKPPIAMNSFDNPRANPPLIPVSVLFSDPKYSMVKLSPNGKWLSYLAPYQGVKNVWVASFAQIMTQIRKGKEWSGSGIVQTKSMTRPLQVYQWLYDDSLVYYQDTGGDENWFLTRRNVEKGTESVLTPQSGVKADLIKTSPSFPNRFIIKMNDRDPAYSDCYMIDTSSGAPKRTLVLLNTLKFKDVIFDEQLNLRIAYKAAAYVEELDILPNGFEFGNDDDMIYFSLYPGRNGSNIKNWSVVKRISTRDESYITVPYTFDISGTKLYGINSQSDDKSSLIQFDTPIQPNSTGKTLFTGTDADITEVFVDPNTNDPLAIATRFDRNDWRSLSNSFRSSLSTIKNWAKDQGGEIDSLASDTKMNFVIIGITDVNIPTKYAILDRRTNQIYPLLKSNPTLERYELPASYSKIIKTRDGYDQLCYLTLPSDVDSNGMPTRSVPLVMLPHGGPWYRDRRYPDPQLIMLANRGYSVMQCQFRGSTGFGKLWIEMGNGEWGKKMQDDIIDGVEWAITNRVTSRDKVAIVGTSYGGYAALVGLTFTPEIFACGVDISGPGNLITLLQTIPSYWAPFIAQYIRLIGADWKTPQGRKFLEAISPISKVDEIQKPLLIVQGTNDPRVKMNEAEQIVDAMLSNGLPVIIIIILKAPDLFGFFIINNECVCFVHVTYVVFPDEGHVPVRSENRIAANSIVDNFLQTCLNGRAENLNIPQQSSLLVEQKGNMSDILARVRG